MFLGISYNRWHGIIALAGEIVISIALHAWLALNYWYAYLFAFWVSFTAQCVYEIYQLFFTDIDDIYGGCKYFIKDSKDDFLNFFGGSVFAFAGILAIVVFGL